MTKKHRYLSLVMALTMLLSVFPVNALAAETEQAEPTAVVEEVPVPAEEEPAVPVEEEPAAPAEEEPAVPVEEEAAVPVEEDPLAPTEKEVFAPTEEEPSAPVEEEEEEAAEVSEPAVAANITSGSCGKNVTWKLEGTKLTISGTGAMDNYTKYEAPPWSGPNITSVVINKGVTAIGEFAFFGCSSLSSVSIPNSVTSIGMCAFYRCSKLTSVTIPSGVKKLEYGIFAECTNLTGITIPNGVTAIEVGAFSNCTALRSVTIPNSVTSIGEGAFEECSSLASITIPNSVSKIGDHAFGACSSLTSVTIPDSVTSIEKEAFAYCDKLEKVTIQNGVTCIPYQCFYECTSLKSITIPDSVTSIGQEAFAYCHALTKLIIPPTVTDIEPYAFMGSRSLTIYGKTGSRAEAFAKEWGIPFKSMIFKVGAPVITKAENIEGGIRLTWKKEPNADLYEIWRKSGSEGWKKLNTTTGTTYTNKGVSSDTIYTYKVRAVNSISSADSAEKKLLCLSAPELVSVTNGTKGVTVKWKSVKGAAKYEIWRKTGSGSWSKINTVSGTSYTNSGVTSGNTYSYSVKAINGSSYSGRSASGLTIKCLSAPVIKSITNENGYVRLEWDAVKGAQKYEIYRKAPGDTSWKRLNSCTGTVYRNTGVTSGKTYSYTVKALSGSYSSGYDNTGKKILCLSRPAVSSVTYKSGTGVTVTWAKVAGAAYYEIYRKDGNGSWTKINSSTGTSYVNKGVTKGHTYSYTVRAFNGTTRSACDWTGKSVTVK